MSAEILKIGFIGGALDSAVGYAHFTACRMDRRWELAAGAFSRKPEINLRTGLEYGVDRERLYDSWRGMIAAEQGRLDAVAILTPTVLHAEMVKECLACGMPVVCEKSLVTEVDDAMEIRELCRSKKGFLALIYNYSGYPMVRELRSLIRRGMFGKILHFQAEMPQEGFIRTDGAGNRPSPQAWRMKDGTVPIIHLDLGSHLHELIYYLTGEHPERVVADQDSWGWFRQVVDNVCCLCRYTGGLQGQMWFSKSALGYRNGLRLRIYGEKAGAEWCQANPEELVLNFADGRRQIMDRGADSAVAGQPRYTRFKAGHPAGFVEAMANLYGDIADGLVEYKKNGSYRSEEFFGTDVALEGLRFLEAMAESAGSGKWVALG